MVESKDNYYLRDYLTNKKLFLQILTSRGDRKPTSEIAKSKGQPFGDAIVKSLAKY